jgi:hypothetical protein
MFAFIEFAGQTRILDIWRPANPLQFSPASAISIRRKLSYSDNPVIRRKQYDEKNALSKERYAQDRVFREERKKLALATKRAWSDSEKYMFRRRNAFMLWVKDNLKRGVARSWGTHTPDYSLDNKSVVRYCDQCGNDRRKDLWWKPNNDHGSYIVRMTSIARNTSPLAKLRSASTMLTCCYSQCHPCFVEDWLNVRLTGYEYVPKSVKSEQKPVTLSKGISDQAKPPAESKP